MYPLFINNIRHGKPLPVYGRGENVRDWLYVVDHARAIDLIFHQGRTCLLYTSTANNGRIIKAALPSKKPVSPKKMVVRCV